MKELIAFTYFYEEHQNVQLLRLISGKNNATFALIVTKISNTLYYYRVTVLKRNVLHY